MLSAILKTKKGYSGFKLTITYLLQVHCNIFPLITYCFIILRSVPTKATCISVRFLSVHRLGDSLDCKTRTMSTLHQNLLIINKQG